MSSVHPTGLRRQKPVEKASQLIVDGKVRLTSARVYEVQGDHDTYLVIADDTAVICPCDARTPLCSHVLAAAIVEQHRRATEQAIAEGSAA